MLALELDVEALRRDVEAGLVTVLAVTRSGLGLLVAVPAGTLEDARARFAGMPRHALLRLAERLLEEASAMVAGWGSDLSAARRDPRRISLAVLPVLHGVLGGGLVERSPLASAVVLLDPDRTRPLGERGGASPIVWGGTLFPVGAG